VANLCIFVKVIEVTTEDWELFLTGDKDAYSKIYTLFYKRLFNYGVKFGGDSDLIEDSIQEIFLYFWKNKEKAQDIKSFHSYLIVSFRNHLFRLMKDRNKVEPYTEFDLHIEFSNEDRWIENEERSLRVAKLEKTLQQLTPRQKEVIFLKYYEGFALC
jgi:RNA polymerase sigma factor (sigma-70 family)